MRYGGVLQSLFVLAALASGVAGHSFGRREGLAVGLEDAAFKCDITEAEVPSKLQAIQRELDGVPQEDTRVSIRRLITKISRCPGAIAHHRPALVEAATAYFRHYRKAVAYKPAVQFFHVSKSGGSSFCGESRSAGCRAPMDGVLDNCFAYFDGPFWIPYEKAQVKSYWAGPQGRRSIFPLGKRKKAPTGREPGKYDSCSARAQWASQYGITFFANEAYTLGGAGVHGPEAVANQGPCSEFVNIMIFRNPLTRALSNYVHLRREMTSAFTKNAEAEAQRKKAITGADMAAWAELAPTTSHNYNARVLLGERVFELPLGQVNTTYLPLAKRVLDKFDVILIMEKMSTPEGNNVLNHGLGWDRQQPVDHRHKSKKTNGLSLGELTPENRAVLESNNAVDMALYAYANELYDLDVAFYKLLPEDLLGELRDSHKLACKHSCGWACQPDFKDWTGQFHSPGWVVP